MAGRKHNWSCPRYLVLGLSAGMLLGWAGGCKSKPKEIEPAEPLAWQGIERQAPEPLAIEGQPLGGVLLKVGQEVITTSDALTALSEKLEELGKISRGLQFRLQAEQLIVQYLRSRMAEILLLHEAEEKLDEQGRILAQRQTEAYEQELLRVCDNSLTRLRKKLRAEGTTLEEELKNFRRGLVVRTYLRGEFASRINVNRQDIVDYYNQHHEQYNSPRKVELLKIQIITDKHFETGEGLSEAQDRSRQIAQDAWDELAKAVEFGQVARKYSDVRKDQGGNWGQVNPASLIEAKERDALQRLKVGEYSQVLENNLGYSIVAVAKIIPAWQTPLGEVQEEIRQQLWNKQYRRMENERLMELGRRAVITVSPLAMSLAMELAERRYASGR